MNSPRLLAPISLVLVSTLSFAQIKGGSNVAPGLNIDPVNPTRSGLMRIKGTGFGSGTNSQIWIAGLKAPVASWTDDLIECYVPDKAALGKTTLTIVGTGGGVKQVRTGSITVLPREASSGRFTWRVKLADQYVPTRPALGPDGTVYAIGNFGHLYAVAADGGLKWVATPPGGVGGIVSVHPNGNIIVGGGGGVQALSPIDGSQVWHFSLNTPLVAGPAVGPDGNIYAVDDSRWSQDVIGAFVLSPSGQLLWNGGKYYRRGGGWTPQEIQFGGGNAYFWSDYSSTGDPDVLGGMNAIKIGNGLRWRVADGVGIMPSSMLNGNVSLFTPSTIQQRDVTGNLLWSQNLNQFGGQPQDMAVAASDGRTYFITSNAKINSISPTGQIVFSKQLGGIVSNHVVRQDANQFVLQYQPNWGWPAQIQGYDKSANLQWSAELPVDNGMTIVCYNHMVYHPSGETVYFGTAGPYDGPVTAHCYLYSLDAR